MSNKNLYITIEAEVSDSDVAENIKTLLDTTLPYMADNVLVTSAITEPYL